MKHLKEKHVVVTGASSGFGRAIALACAAEGAQVALIARRAEKLKEVAAHIEARGQQALICPTDVAVEADIKATSTFIKETWGKVDILVNNAGTNLNSRRIAETTSEEWRTLIDVNLTSAFLFTKTLLPLMIEQKEGSIINIASRAASHPGLIAGVAYSSAKRAMEALTKITNEEANPHNIRACVINPGAANTPIMDLRPEPPSEAQRELMMQAEDIAEAVVFVASLPQRVTIETIEMRPTRT